VSVFTSTGGAAISPITSGNGLDNPQAIAIDVSGHAWVANYGNSNVSVFTSSGGVDLDITPTSGNGLNKPNFIAIDGSGNAWVTDYTSNPVSGVLSELTSSGGVAGSSPFSGSYLAYVGSVAIDGAGNAWVGNGNDAVSEFSSSGSLSPNGLGTAAYGVAGSSYGIAIDGSGNVWTADQANNILIELVGAATPVVTPIAANLMSPYGTATVNVP